MDVSIAGFKPAYLEENAALYCGDTFDVMSHIQAESIDMIFADPPYFLSNGGFSNSGGKMVPVDKGTWDRGTTFEEKHQFNREWIRLCHTILKPNGTI